jgi:hypothetical protein
MRARKISIQNFRGLEAAEVLLGENLALSGEPRAGRSTVIEAFRRVLLPQPMRRQILDDLDFHNRRTTLPIEIEVILGDLGDEFEQDFFNQLESWDKTSSSIIDKAPETEGEEWCVRLAYHAEWRPESQQIDHFVYFPKTSDPENQSWARVSTSTLERLPIINFSLDEQVLSVASRTQFRGLVDEADGSDFVSSLNDFAADVVSLGESVAKTTQVVDALARVTKNREQALSLENSDEPLSYTLGRGGVAGVLRALAPTLKIDEGESLPVDRHGSTLTSAIGAAQSIAEVRDRQGIVLADDFGEAMNEVGARSAIHALLQAADQCIVSTRRASALQSFELSELARLTIRNGKTALHRGSKPATRSERIAIRHLGLQILPAVASETVMIVEGHHDFAALDALQRRRDIGAPQLAGAQISLIHAAAADGSGGDGAIPRLAALAKQFGFHVIGVIDGDLGNEVQTERIKSAGDAVIRLPDGMAIERLLVEELDAAELREIINLLEIPTRADLLALDDEELRAGFTKDLKRHGLHAQLVDALNTDQIPSTALRLFGKVVELAKDFSGANEQL